MEIPLVVYRTGAQEIAEVTGEGGPLSSETNNNDGQQLSLQIETMANCIESIISKTTTLRAETSKLKAELALEHQKMTDRLVEISKMDHTFHLENHKKISRVQHFMKADKPQNMSYSNEMDRILKYVEWQNTYHLKWDLNALKLQHEQNL